MATKRGKRSGAKASSTRTRTASKPKTTAKAKARAKAAAPGKRSGAPAAARRAVIRAVAPARRQAAPPALLQRAKALRDVIQRSKMTAPDPWRYTPKARTWLGRVERLLDRISASVETAEMRKAVETLAAEVEGDRDFQDARRLF